MMIDVMTGDSSVCESHLLGTAVSMVVLRRSDGILPLFAVEHDCVANAGFKRRREFAAGRYCARLALIKLGELPCAIPQSENGLPQWPKGVVGSVSHTEGLVVAAVARQSEISSIGVDAELIGAIGKDLWHTIFTPNEIQSLVSASDNDVGWLETVMFCAKEAFYKCQFPLTGQWLDFIDVEVRILDSTFIVKIDEARHDGLISKRKLWGRFAVIPPYVLAGILCK